MNGPEDKSWLIQCIAAVLLAAAGGPLGYLTRATDNGETVSKKALLVQTLSAAFTGCIVLLICLHFEFDMIVSGIMCGVSGWMGAMATLGLVTRQIKSKLGIKDEDKNDA